MQKDTNTSKIWISWESMATPGKVYEYDIVSKEKKLVKEVEEESGVIWLEVAQDLELKVLRSAVERKFQTDLDESSSED